MWLNLSKRCGKPCQTSIDVLSANQNKQTNKQISELVMHQLIWLFWWLNSFTVLVCFPTGVKNWNFSHTWNWIIQNTLIYLSSTRIFTKKINLQFYSFLLRGAVMAEWLLHGTGGVQFKSLRWQFFLCKNFHRFLESTFG